ncbi:MAG: hypothetical protein WC718_18185 [Phycisphaerales bacterium]|jgi:hypothetical protein
MSEQKHTPGPFTVHGPSLDRIDPTKCGDYAICNEQGHIVAEAYRLVANDVELPAEANARLFASAPDLLAENERLRGVVEAAQAYRHTRDQGAAGAESYHRLCLALARLDGPANCAGNSNSCPQGEEASDG